MAHFLIKTPTRVSLGSTHKRKEAEGRHTKRGDGVKKGENQ